MEKSELEYIKGYCQRLNHSMGDLSELNKDERHHLSLLLRKFELEQTLDKIAEDLSQVQLL